MSTDDIMSAERGRALEAMQKLRLAIDDTEAMMTAIGGAREHMDVAVQELRGQSTIIKERVNWLIRELDTLRKQIGTLTRPGDTR